MTALAQDQWADAERVAKIYMTAFLAGDIKTAANLTDPKTLDRMREAFLGELLRADPDSEKAILANFGPAATTAGLSHLDAKALYVAVTEAEQRKNPAVLETMKQMRFKVIATTPNPGGGVNVRFRVTNPASGTAAGEDSALLMKQVEGDWKVVGRAPP